MQKKSLTFPWLNFVKKILGLCGLSYIWISQTFVSDTSIWLKLAIKIFYVISSNKSGTIWLMKIRKPLTIDFSGKIFVLKSTSTFLMINKFCFFVNLEQQTTAYLSSMVDGIMFKENILYPLQFEWDWWRVSQYYEMSFFNQSSKIYISKNLYQRPEIKIKIKVRLLYKSGLQPKVQIRPPVQGTNINTQYNIMPNTVVIISYHHQ